MARIMVTMANKSSRDTARRVSAARERGAANGKWGGGKRPFGFLADGVTVDPVEAAEIVKACEAVLAGVSLRQLALDLRAREVPTVKGTRWTAQTLKDILVRPRNAGILVYRPETERTRGGAAIPAKRYYTPEDEIGKATWEPIIPEDTWRAVFAKLTDPNRSMRPGPANRWLGSGIYRCICGTFMQVQVKRDGTPPRYRCRDTGSGNGVRHVIRNVAAVDEVVVKAVVEIMSRPDAADLNDAPAVDQGELGALRSQVATLRARKRAFATDYAAGLIDREDMLAGVARVRHEIQERESRLTAHTGRSPLSPLIGVDDVREVWDGLSLGMQREIVSELMEVNILPSPGRGRSPFDPASVQIEEVPLARRA